MFRKFNWDAPGSQREEAAHSTGGDEGRTFFRLPARSRCHNALREKRALRRCGVIKLGESFSDILLQDRNTSPIGRARFDFSVPAYSAPSGRIRRTLPCKEREVHTPYAFHIRFREGFYPVERRLQERVVVFQLLGRISSGTGIRLPTRIRARENGLGRAGDPKYSEPRRDRWRYGIRPWAPAKIAPAVPARAW